MQAGKLLFKKLTDHFWTGESPNSQEREGNTELYHMMPKTSRTTLPSDATQERGDARVSLQFHEDCPARYEQVSPMNKQREPRPTLALLGEWGWEAAGILVSAAIIIAIVVVLGKYNGHKQQDWEHISLNSLISWLSTLAKACVLFSISQGIGQLKWVWFANQSRPLSDLDTFDSASRGVTGSAALLWLVKGQYVPCGCCQSSPRQGIMNTSC